MGGIGKPGQDHEHRVVHGAIAALDMIGLTTEEISVVMSWSISQVVQYMEERANEISSRQSEIRLGLLNDLDVETLAKSHLKSLVNEAFLFFQDMMHGGTPMGVSRPWRSFGEVSLVDQMKAAKIIIDMGVSSSKQIVSEAILELPPEIDDSFVTTVVESDGDEVY